MKSRLATMEELRRRASHRMKVTEIWLIVMGRVSGKENALCVYVRARTKLLTYIARFASSK